MSPIHTIGLEGDVKRMFQIRFCGSEGEIRSIFTAHDFSLSEVVTKLQGLAYLVQKLATQTNWIFASNPGQVAFMFMGSDSRWYPGLGIDPDPTADLVLNVMISADFSVEVLKQFGISGTFIRTHDGDLGTPRDDPGKFAWGKVR